jgi:hypothetical protein
MRRQDTALHLLQSLVEELPDPEPQIPIPCAGAAAPWFLTVFSFNAAFAHYCTPANKKDGAGSIGTYNIMTGQFTPNKNYVKENMGNAGFITITDGQTFSYDVFLHQTLPAGALASGPEGDNGCDGRGVDDALTCLGIPH